MICSKLRINGFFVIVKTFQTTCNANKDGCNHISCSKLSMLWFVITRSSCDLFFLELDTFFIVNGNRREEDGMRVVLVENMKNPYESNLGGINRRFKLTLNKLYAWTLVDYERVVMIDSDNIFLQKTDELFQCGQFCAVFINPCYFHTGLFVLQVR